VKVLAAEGRGGEREREERGSTDSRNEGGGWFFVDFEPNSPPLDHENQIYL